MIQTELKADRLDSSTQMVQQTKLNEWYQFYLNAFHQACETFQECPRFLFQINGIQIKLVFAGQAMLTEMTAAFKHLQTTRKQEPDLTIYCWDSVSTQTPLTFFPWSNKAHSLKREIPYFRQNGMHIAYRRESEVLSLLNSHTRTGLFWTREASLLPYYEKASPMRTLLQWQMQSMNRLCIHSAAVAAGNKGVLLAGREKAGKSTSSLFCLLAGMQFAGDDYVVLQENGNYWAYSLYSTLKLEAHAAKEMPDILAKADNIQQLNSEKAVLYLQKHYPEQLPGGFPVLAVLLPQIAGIKRTMIRKATSGEGMKALAPTTLFLQPGLRKEAFVFLTRFFQKTPCFWLDLGTDISEIPMAIDQFVRSL